MHSLDSFVLTRYQSLVDYTGKSHKWLVEQSVYAQVLFVALTYVLGYRVPNWLTAMFVIASVFMVFMARTVADKLIRYFCLVALALDIFVLVFAGDALAALRFLSTLSTTSFWYFMACEPPKPRHRYEPSRSLPAL